MNHNHFGMHAASAGGQQQHIVAGLFAETQRREQRTLLRNKRNLMDVTMEDNQGEWITADEEAKYESISGPSLYGMVSEGMRNGGDKCWLT